MPAERVEMRRVREILRYRLSKDLDTSRSRCGANDLAGGLQEFLLQRNQVYCVVPKILAVGILPVPFHEL